MSFAKPQSPLSTTEPSDYRPLRTRCLSIIASLLVGYCASQALFFFDVPFSSISMVSRGLVWIITILIGSILHTMPDMKKISLPTTGISMVLSVFTLIGKLFSQQSEGLVSGGVPLVIAFIGYAALFNMMLGALTTRSYRYGIEQQARIGIVSQNAKDTTITHPMMVSFMVILLGWSCYIIMFFPGIGFYDSLWQLGQFFGYSQLNSQHPLSATLVLGIFTSIGLPLGSTAAFAIYTTIQIFTVATFLAYCASYLYRFTPVKNFTKSSVHGRGRNRTAWLLFTVFATINPLFPIYSMTILKDVPYALCIGVISLLLVDRFSGENSVRPAVSNILAIVALLGVSMLRGEGPIVSLICLVLLTCMPWKKKRISLLIAGTLGIILVISGNAWALRNLDVKPSSRLEVMSLPLQQLAREMRYNPDTFSLAERDTLHSMLKQGESVETIGHKYDPSNIDSVKLSFQPEFSGRQFLQLWLHHFAMHPTIYITATLNSTYGFIYPFNLKPGNGSVYDSFQWFNPETRYNWHVIALGIPDNHLNPSYPDLVAPMRNWFLAHFSTAYTVPGISLFLKPASFVFIGLMASAIALKNKRNRMLLTLIPSLIVFAVCLTSPINESIRYALPLLFSTPMVFLSIFVFSSPSHVNRRSIDKSVL